MEIEKLFIEFKDGGLVKLSEFFPELKYNAIDDSYLIKGIPNLNPKIKFIGLDDAD